MASLSAALAIVGNIKWVILLLVLVFVILFLTVLMSLVLIHVGHVPQSPMWPLRAFPQGKVVGEERSGD